MFYEYELFLPSGIPTVFSTYQLEIEFSDSEELSISPIDGDESQPQKLYSRNFSLGGYGINLGVKFVLWKR